MFGAHARHQILERGIDDVGLERPDNFISAHACIGPAAHSCQQRRKSRIGNDDEMFVDMSVDRLRQDNRPSRSKSGCEISYRVGWMREKEGMPIAAREFANARFLSWAASGRKWQRLDHQRAQIIFEHDLFKISMKLRNRRVSTANRHELTTVLSQKKIVEGMHFVLSVSVEDGDSSGASEPKPFWHFADLLVYANFGEIC